jgi:hypothetical protein
LATRADKKFRNSQFALGKCGVRSSAAGGTGGFEGGGGGDGTNRKINIASLKTDPSMKENPA